MEQQTKIVTHDRMLQLKLHFDWYSEESKKNHKLLSDLAWEEARFRNGLIRRLWAEKMGFRVAPENQDPHDITKQGRKDERGTLSSVALDGSGREVFAAWKKALPRVMAGAPLPEWSPKSAFSIRGQRPGTTRGVRLEIENGWYVLYLQAQFEHAENGGWLRLPTARNTSRDKHQRDILTGMVARTVRITKVSVRVKRHGAIIWLGYEKAITRPILGNRVATLGPIGKGGRLLLRTELQQKDYTSKLVEICRKKDSWDLIRRRVMAQVGWKKGQARAKRQTLLRVLGDKPENWTSSHLHAWTREIADWLVSQGVGTLHLANLETLDWPAYRFKQMLQYKLSDAGITMDDLPDLAERSSDRAAKAEARKVSHKVGKRNLAVRELAHQLKETI